jgi:hypothetical protein
MFKQAPIACLFPCALLAGCASVPGVGAAWNDCASFDAITTPAVSIAAVCTRRDDGALAISGSPSGYLAARGVYADYRLHVEWRWSGRPGNGGVLLHIASGPKDGVWPLSQQVQLKHGSAGDVLPMAGARFDDPLTTAPGAYPAIKARLRADSERPAGAWNSVDVTSRGGTLEVVVNGVVQNRVGGAAPRAGRIGFQLEGAPYALRNVRIMPLE